MIVGELWRRLMFFFRREQFDRELAEEMEHHVEMKEQARVERGMPLEQARHAARREFGNALLLRERSRDAWGWERTDSVRGDIVSSARRIRRHPRNPLVLMFTLAIAVGTVIGIFDVAYQGLYGALPYRQPGRIVVADSRASAFLVSPYNWQANPRASATFERIAEYHLETANLGSESRRRRLLIACVTPQFFSVLGVRMALGNDLSDMTLPSPNSAVSWLPIVLSHRMWRNDFDSDKKVLGREITLKLLYPYHFQVVGIAPAGVSFPPGVDAWIPEHLVGSSMIQTAAPPNWRDVTIGRLKPGISLSQAEAAIRSWPRKGRLWIWNDSAGMIPLREFLEGNFYRLGPLLWLVTIPFLVLTITAAVSISRLDFEERDEEFRIRKVLGATPSRLFRSQCIETTAIFSLALALEFLVRLAVVRTTVRYLQLPFASPTSPTWIDLVLAVGTAVLGAILIVVPQGCELGVFPFFVKPRGGVCSAEKELRVVPRLRFPLQIAAATMILVVAVLLGRSSYAISHMDPGVRPLGTYVCEITLPFNEEKYALGGIDRALSMKDREHRINVRFRRFHLLMNFYFSLILRQIRGHAGVTKAGVISIAPYSGYPAFGTGVYISRSPLKSPHSEPLSSHFVSMGPGAIPALGMKVLYGRNFSNRPDANADRNTVIINEAMAKRIGPGAASLGEYAIWPGAGVAPARIVGIVRNVHTKDLFTPVAPTVYYPFSEFGLSDVDVVFRASRNIPFRDAYSLIQSTVRSVVPGATVSRFESLEEMVMSAGVLTRYSTYFLLALAALGVFMVGVCAWAKSVGEIRRREHEIGIRLALGAEAGQLVRSIAGRQVVSSLFAACLGAVFAWWFSRLAAYLFHGVNPSGTGNYLFSVAAIGMYVLLISVWALQRAIRRNPLELIASRSL